MKKLICGLALAGALTALGMGTASAEHFWKYNDTMQIDLDETKLQKTTNGHEVLRFVAVQTIPDGTVTYTYVYDRTAGTIQVETMEKETKKLHYTSNFTPESVNSPNPVIRQRAEMAEAVYQRKVNKK